MRRIAQTHDMLSKIGMILGGIAILAIVAAYGREVIGRYIFDNPSIWASDMVSYLLCASIFLALPQATANNAHISVTLLGETLPRHKAMQIERLIFALAAGTCFVAMWLTLTAANQQFESGIETVATVAIPKWWLSAIMTYGFSGAGLHFLRQAFATGKGE